jgi:vancomycin resistance protein YoaR
MLGGAALLSLPSVLPSRAAATDERPPPLVRIAGERVELMDPAVQAQHIAEEWANSPQRLQLTEQTLVRTRAELGGSVDVEHLTRLLRDVQNPASALRRRAESAEELTLALPVRFDAEPARALLLELKRQHDHPPSDARFNPDTREVIAERAGLSLDVWATLDDLDAALHHGAPEIAVRVVRTDAQRTAAELRDVRVDARLGDFETRYSLNESAADRTHNLRVAARKIDGLVLLPGEVFDFNAVVGERNEASGFRPAPTIAGGELVDGLGGGACQIAGTIHAAAFFAGLTILERHPHSRPSFYIKLGLDAAVSYPTINLVIRNDHPFPVVIRMRLEGRRGALRGVGPRATRHGHVRAAHRLRHAVHRVGDARQQPAPPACASWVSAAWPASVCSAGASFATWPPTRRGARPRWTSTRPPRRSGAWAPAVLLPRATWPRAMTTPSTRPTNTPP